MTQQHDDKDQEVQFEDRDHGHAVINILASSLPGSYGSLQITKKNTEYEGAETNRAGVSRSSLCLVSTEPGSTFINIMCIYTHAQNLMGVKAQGKPGILLSQKTMQKYF